MNITLVMKPLSEGDVLKRETNLSITFYNEDEEVPNYEEDPDVQFNYLRLLTANKMIEAR